MNVASPIPKNLREQLVSKAQSIPDKYLALFHEAWLDAETVRLLDEMNEQAENEQAEGKWENLPELIRAYRDRRTTALRAA
jgi:cation transport regulator ChaB